MLFLRRTASRLLSQIPKTCPRASSTCEAILTSSPKVRAGALLAQRKVASNITTQAVCMASCLHRALIKLICARSPLKSADRMDGRLESPANISKKFTSTERLTRLKRRLHHQHRSTTTHNRICVTQVF